MGAMLLAQRLSDFPTLARKAARVVVYEGTNKIKSRLDTATMDPNPFDAGYAVIFNQLFEFIKAQVPRHQVIQGALRHDIALLPDIAIRELVPNALIHQDFKESGTSVVVEIYTNRMEIINPGRPIIPVERFITENKSRNEAVAKAMRLMRICEEQGSGMQKTIFAVEGQRLPAPDFRVGETRTTVVLYGPKTFAQMEKSERVRACFQHCCLKWITNERMTNQSLRERFGLPNNQSKITAMYQLISEAIALELIKPAETESGSKRYAAYVPIWD
jgi:ATP-dependent DNA helicase RecG